MKNKRMNFYQINPRYFKDGNADGVGDLKGLGDKFDYFDFMNVDALIFENLIPTIYKDPFPQFTKVAKELGGINSLLRISSLAKKRNIKLLMELNIGSINELHNWFISSSQSVIDGYDEVIDFKSKDDNPHINYGYSQKRKKYYISDSKTKEVPLNWGSNQVPKLFMDVIKFWLENGIDGFVFKNFEHLSNPGDKEVMTEDTIRTLKDFYATIKEIKNDIIIMGKSDIIDTYYADMFVEGHNKIFDYFLSTKISHLEINLKYGLDAPAKFTPRKFVRALKSYAPIPQNVISFGSSLIGRVVSRWGDDGQFKQESAKTLAMLLFFNPYSTAIYSGDELGVPNIGLTHLDDFQTPDLELRKQFALSKGITRKEFMDAQVINNPINARSLMSWNEEPNGGFSLMSVKLVTPISDSFKELNVKNEFLDEKSSLNFYKEAMKMVAKPAYKNIIDKGEYKISLMLSNIIKVEIINNDKALFIYANLSRKNKMIFDFFKKNEDKKVILSSYEKDYNDIPCKLAPYETILVSKDVGVNLRLTQKTRIQEAKAKIKEEKLKSELIKLKNAEEAKAQEKAKKDAAKAKVNNDHELREKIKQAQEEEKLQLIKEKKEETQARKEAIHVVKEIKAQENQFVKEKIVKIKEENKNEKDSLKIVMASEKDKKEELSIALKEHKKFNKEKLKSEMNAEKEAMILEMKEINKNVKNNENHESLLNIGSKNKFEKQEKSEKEFSIEKKRFHRNKLLESNNLKKQEKLSKKEAIRNEKNTRKEKARAKKKHDKVKQKLENNAKKEADQLAKISKKETQSIAIQKQKAAVNFKKVAEEKKLINQKEIAREEKNIEKFNSLKDKENDKSNVFAQKQKLFEQRREDHQAKKSEKESNALARAKKKDLENKWLQKEKEEILKKKELDKGNEAAKKAKLLKEKVEKNQLKLEENKKQIVVNQKLKQKLSNKKEAMKRERIAKKKQRKAAKAELKKQKKLTHEKSEKSEKSKLQNKNQKINIENKKEFNFKKWGIDKNHSETTNDNEQAKYKAIAERKARRNHLDEATKLTEDELAKTTLINDESKLEDLFPKKTKK